MLTQIRHFQKGILIAVTIIIVIAFTVSYSSYDASRKNLGTEECVFRAYGKCYRLKEAQKLSNTMKVAMQFGMYEFAMDLFGRNRLDQDDTNFIMSLVILRKEAAKMGIEPSFQEIQEAIPNLPALKSQPWMNEDIIQNMLSSNGFTMGDFQDLVSDYLSWQKLRELVASGVEPVPSEVERLYKDEYQRFEAMVVDFKRASFEEKVKPTDEEIQTFYDENKESLNSELKRAFEMVTFTQGALAENATEEQKANARLDFEKFVGKVYSDIATTPSDFLKIANAQKNAVSVNQVKVKKIEALAASDAPERFTSESGLMQGLFTKTLGKGNITKLFKLKDGSSAVFLISDQMDPRPLSLEEAKEQIVKVLKLRTSNEMAQDAANEARNTLLEAIKAGKSFAEAAKGAGLEVRKIPNFSQSEPPAETEDANAILYSVSGTSAGELGEVVAKPNGGGYLLSYVDKIEIYGDSSKETKLGLLSSAQKREDQNNLFAAWFNQRRSEAGAQRRGRIVPEEEIPNEESPAS
ncbi:SurA N-terminal domain-containing protein [Verrucomicrobiales bacterium]|nr:SurA N-terminal domain-containing protein [Verrucomicrobiales bacterium]MDC0321873.1 SurA N-terminal domain-containing protein [Verrucomicrobiales bacterium]